MGAEGPRFKSGRPDTLPTTFNALFVKGFGVFTDSYPLLPWHAIGIHFRQAKQVCHPIYGRNGEFRPNFDIAFLSQGRWRMAQQDLFGFFGCADLVEQR